MSAMSRETSDSGIETAVNVLIALALAIYLAYLAVYVNYAVALFGFPFDYDQGEGFELVDSILLSRGEWPYRSVEEYPFYSSNYPPLFHIFAAPFVLVFGPRYWIGRALSFLATLINAALIGYAVWRETRDRKLSALSGLAFLASNYVYHVGPLFRQHMTMVMFETAAIVTIHRFDEIQSVIRRCKVILLGLLLLLAAGYTKQLAVITVAAFFGYMFLRRPKSAVVYGLILAVVAGIIFIWIDLATDGAWSLNIITANYNEYIVGQFLGLARQWFLLHRVILLLAAGLALYELYFDRLSVYSVWFAFAVAGNTLAGKWGAGESYFATSIAAACILAGIALHKLIGLFEGKARKFAWVARFAVPILFIIQAGYLVHMPTYGPIFGSLADLLGLPDGGEYYDSVGYTQIGRPPTRADTEAGVRIAGYIESDPRPAMSEDAGFSIYAGREVVGNPTQLLNLYNNGLFDPTEMVRWIDNQMFGVVILRAQFYPPPVLDAIGAAYDEVARIEMNGFEYIIMRPDPDYEPQVSPPEPMGGRSGRHGHGDGRDGG